MRIALVTHHAHAFAGVPQYVSCLARSLSAQHDVTVISSTFDGLEGTGIHHRRLRAIGSGGPVFELSFFLSSAITLWRERRSEAGFDVVHSHHYSSPLFSDLLTSHYCEVEGIRQVRRRPTGAPVPGFRQRLRSRIMAAMEAALFGASSATPLIVLSQGMKRDSVRHHRTPAGLVHVVPSGVDTERFHPGNTTLHREAVRRDHGVSELITDVGGVARYEGDHYHWDSALDDRRDTVPGNPWVVTTLWLARYRIAMARDTDELRQGMSALEWVADRALPSGVLAEQFHPDTGEPRGVSPLTWSHASVVETVRVYLEKQSQLMSDSARA